MQMQYNEYEISPRITKYNQILQAVKDGSITGLKSELASLQVESSHYLFGLDINSTDKMGDSFLHYSTSGCRYSVSELLIKEGIDVNLKNFQGETALLQASRFGNFDLVKLFLKSGANPNIYDLTSDSALLWASFKGYYEIVHALIEGGAEPSHRYTDGRDAFMWAVRQNHVSIANFLIQFWNEINYADKHDLTAFDLAKGEIQSILIQKVNKNKISVISKFLEIDNKSKEFGVLHLIFSFYCSDNDGEIT